MRRGSHEVVVKRGESANSNLAAQPAEFGSGQQKKKNQRNLVKPGELELM